MRLYTLYRTDSPPIVVRATIAELEERMMQHTKRMKEKGVPIHLIVYAWTPLVVQQLPKED